MPKIERNKDLGSIYFFNVSAVQSGWQNDILYITFIIPGIWKELLVYVFRCVLTCYLQRYELRITKNSNLPGHATVDQD